jgi:hypothetical protein
MRPSPCNSKATAAEAARLDRSRHYQAAEFAWRLRRLALAISQTFPPVPPDKSQTISPNAAMDKNDHMPS